VTVFGLFLTPIFYVVLMKLGRKKAPVRVAESPESKHGLPEPGAAPAPV
jgi:hypothetical protein